MAIPFIREFDDFAEAMATPNPNRPIQEAAAKIGRSFCDAISARPGTFAPTILQSPLKAACKPYWDSQGYDGPEEVSPYSGGQCADTYLVYFTLSGTDLNIGGQTPKNLLGPLGGVTRIDTVIGSPFFDTTRVQFIFDGPNDGVEATYRTSFGDTPGIRIDGIVGGAPDNCGDPPPVTVPGDNPAPDPGPLPPDVGPSFDIRGNPIFVLPPTLEVSPDINIELSPGEINLGSGTGNTTPGAPLAGEDTPGEGSGDGGGDNDFGDPPDGERWVGCCVSITQRPVGHGSIPQSEPETIFPDIVGNVRLKFSSTSQPVEYDTPLINKQKTTCVWEPVRGMQPVGVRVNLRPGFLYSYRPYSVPLEN